MKTIRALLVGVLFLFITPAFAYHGCISDGTEDHPAVCPAPLRQHTEALVAEANRLGQAGNVAFLNAKNELASITAKYPYDLGMIAECQTGITGAERAQAFALVNRMAAVLPGNTVGQFTPLQSVPHAQIVQAITSTWPALKNQPPELLAEAGIAKYVADLSAREARAGTLELAPVTAQHWAVTHAIAMEAMELNRRLDAHVEYQRRLQEMRMNILYTLLLFGVVAAFVFPFASAVSKPRERLGRPMYQVD